MSNKSFYSLVNEGVLLGDMNGSVLSTPPVSVTGATLTCTKEVHAGRTTVISAVIWLEARLNSLAIFNFSSVDINMIIPLWVSVTNNAVV